VKIDSILHNIYKKNDIKKYLLYSSEHPRHMKAAIPYAQALRYKRIIQDPIILDQEFVALRETFVSRGYPIDTVQVAISRADFSGRMTRSHCHYLKR